MNINWLVFPTLALSLFMFWAGLLTVRRLTTPKIKLAVSTLFFLLGIPGYLFPLYFLHIFDKSVWYYEFRSLPYVELSAAGAGLFAGALAELIRDKKWVSQKFIIILLVLGIIAPYLKPVVAPLPGSWFKNQWKGNICMQSTHSTCGAASTATILRSFGYEITEKELAKECHSYLGGTENWYIARAFRRRGFKVTYRIEKGFPDDLSTPAIAGVSLLGIGHFIPILGKKNRKYITGDPLIGRQEIPEGEMRKTFVFTGFFMEIHKVD